MKRIVLISLFLIAIKGMCQYDTSHIRTVFDYLQTNEFKSSLEQLSDRQTENSISEFKAIRKRAKDYRKEQKEHVLFWTSSNRCFTPSHDYFIPDESSRSATNGDSLRFRRFIKQALNMIYSPLSSLQCTEKISPEIYYLDDYILEVHYFLGVDNGRKYGYTEVLRFKVNEAGKADLLLMGGIYHN